MIWIHPAADILRSAKPTFEASRILTSEPDQNLLLKFGKRCSIVTDGHFSESQYYWLLNRLKKVRVRMWPIVTPENDCNVAFQKQTNAAKCSIQKQTRIGLWIGLDTGFLPCCVTIPKPTNTTFKNKLEYRLPLRHRNSLKPGNVEKGQGSGRMHSLSVKMIRTAVRAAALAKMLGFVKVSSYIGLWRTVLTGSMVTRMVTHYGKLLYELQRYVVYQARPIC